MTDHTGKIKELHAILLAVLVVAIWGETFVSSKIVLSAGLRPADLFSFRFVIAYLGMWVISHKRKVCENWKDELVMALLGFCGGTLYFLTENSALSYSTASNVAILVSSTPLVTALLASLFYKEERMNGKQLLGSLVAFAGMALVVFNGEVVLKLNPIGDLLALGASLSWGFYSVLMKKVMGRYESAFITRKVFGYGLVGIVLYFIFMGWPDVDAAVLAEPAVWGNVIYLGVVASLVCYLVWNRSMRILGAVRATNIIYLQAFFTMLTGFFVLSERITWMAVLGTVLLILGMSRAVK